MSEFDPRPVTPRPRASAQVPALPTAAPMPAVNFGPPAPWMEAQNEKGGFNILSFLHSLRRRWLLGVGLGFLVASILAALLALLVPIKYQAFVTVRVRRNSAPMFKDSKRVVSAPQDFEIERHTQAFLLKSDVVIMAALRQPGISQMPIVRDEPWPWLFGQRDNPVAWLSRQLKTEVPPDMEIIRLSMRERSPEQLKKLLDTITDAYYNEFVTGVRVEESKKLEQLRERQRDLMKTMNEDLGLISKLANQFGDTKSDSVKIRLELGYQKLSQLDRDRTAIDAQYFETYEQLAMLNQKMQTSANFEPHDFEIENILAQSNPQFALLRQQLVEMEATQALRGARNGGAGGAMAQQASQLRQQLERIKAESKEDAVKQMLLMTNSDERSLQTDMQLLQSKLSLLNQRRDRVYKEYTEMAEKMRKEGAFSSELAVKQFTLDNNQKMLEKLTDEIETTTLEMNSKAQVEVMEHANIPDESNWVMKYMQIIGAWMLTLTGTVLGVALWDMQHKRINTSKEVAEGGDVRVIGSLPLLITRRIGGLLPMTTQARRSVERLLTRSIDSIRTTLLLSRSSNPYQVILVTSALGQEGKTTVASQLAVSLARSGRRTLLIDGDVRNPQQHVVLGIPMQRGLCEVLRSECKLDDVLKATPADGLWFLGAGYRDANIDHYLALPLLGSIFQEIRTRFDVVVVDCSPVLTNPDAMLLGQHSDAAVISIRRDVSRLPKVRDACDRLAVVGIHVAGAVMNGGGLDVRENEPRVVETPTKSEPRIEQSSTAS